jgi:hypothetical protein
MPMWEPPATVPGAQICISFAQELGQGQGQGQGQGL